jgi:hypothetical protein
MTQARSASSRDDEPTRTTTVKPPSDRGRRLSIGAAMWLVVGLACGLWLVSHDIRSSLNAAKPEFEPGMLTERWRRWEQLGLTLVIGVLGGLSVVGPPLLLWSRLKDRMTWGDGRFFWFVQGTASWLLWPPLIGRRFMNTSELSIGDSMSGVCYFYGTPLMALYVTLALLTGGRLRRSRRRRMKRSWQERFGLLLGLAWACTGLYVLSVIYRNDLQR